MKQVLTPIKESNSSLSSFKNFLSFKALKKPFSTLLRFGTSKGEIYWPPNFSLVFLLIQKPSFVGGFISLNGGIS